MGCRCAGQIGMNGMSDAAVALREIGDAGAVLPLVSPLHDDDAGVRDAAAEALAALGWRQSKTEMASRE